MSFFVRCQWMPPSNHAVTARFAEVSKFLMMSTLIGALGRSWFKLGRSRNHALNHEVRLDELADRGAWRRVQLGDSGAYYTSNLWNGRPDPEAASLDAALFDHADQPDTLVVAARLESVSASLSWDNVVSDAQMLARELGGFVVIASTDLDGDAAYAVSWGVDSSGRNPAFEPLTRLGLSPPAALVACDSWEDVRAGARNSRIAALGRDLALGV